MNIKPRSIKTINQSIETLHINIVIRCGTIPFAFSLLCSLFLGPILVDSMSEVFTAEISGMPCSLVLVTQRGKLYQKKSSLQCITNQTVHVPSAVVINDDTDHVFELKLRAKSKNTKLIKGVLLPTPTGCS